MLQYRKSLEILHSEAASYRKRISTESLKLSAAVGRRLSQDVFSAENLPSFNNSAMDGFAICHDDCKNARSDSPIALIVNHSLAAGDGLQSAKEGQGACCEIMTGAQLPGHYDSVVKVEDVEIRRVGEERYIFVRNPVSKGSHIRYAGEDFKKGQRIASRGDVVSPMHVLAMEALGVSAVEVYRALKIALVSTGKELVEVAEVLHESQIRNSTAPFLRSLLQSSAIQIEYFGIVKDEPTEFIRVMKTILDSKPDVIITTGAVSVGKYDFVQNSLKDLGAEILFHKVAMRPGKPILFARFEDGPHVFGLPGNPVSTSVGVRFFVEPYLQSLLCGKPEVMMKARLLHRVPKPEGLRCFFKARMDMTSGEVTANVHKGQASFMVQPLLESNAWAILPELGDEIPEGTMIEFVPLYGPFSGGQSQ